MQASAAKQKEMTMPADNRSDLKGTPPTADQLRMQLLNEQMELAKAGQKARELEQQKVAEFTTKFLTDQVSEDEIAMVRRLVVNAAKDGKFEAMVYSFPSDLCTDGGRAINSGNPGWPDTLRGKARQFFERYETIGKPAGYKMKAMIINFPGGIPGDVGFFLNWAPEQT
jgi:hypothetical protein